MLISLGARGDSCHDLLNQCRTDKSAVAELSRDLNFCKINFKASKCDEFLSDHPELSHQKNTCAPYDVCKQNSQSLFLRGCKDYGIEITTSVTDKLKGLSRNCKAGYLKGLCVTENILKGTLNNLWYYTFNPIIDVRDLPKMPRQFIEHYKSYQQKFSCLNSQAQHKFACMLAVEVGSAVVPAAGALRYAKLIQEMKSIQILSAGMAHKKLFPIISKRLKKSGKFRFFKMSEELPFNETTLTPGKGYTALVSDGKVILGEDFINSNGTRTGTHIKLKALVSSEKNYHGEGGAVRINKDGSIDISGYHRKEKSLEAANLIADYFKKALPEAKIRVTAGRLSELDP